MTRPDRDEWFLQMAELVATRSTCLRGHVGVVIVVEKRIVSIGYNGAPPGQPQCDEVGCDELTVMPVNLPPERADDDEYIELGCQRAVHAEANALAFAARFGTPCADSTMYATHSPCPTCARLLVAAGVIRYVFRREYRVREGIEILDRANVSVEQL